MDKLSLKLNPKYNAVANTWYGIISKQARITTELLKTSTTSVSNALLTQK